MPRRGIDLSEDQWARVKSHAATRRQTISQFLGDVVNEILPDGHVRPATKAGPALLDPSVEAVAGPTYRSEGTFPPAEGWAKPIAPPQPRPPAVPSHGFGTSRAAPKPSQVKKK